MTAQNAAVPLDHVVDLQVQASAVRHLQTFLDGLDSEDSPLEALQRLADLLAAAEPETRDVLDVLDEIEKPLRMP